MIEAQKSTTLTSMPLYRAAELIRQRKVSSAELTRACLARIEEFDPILHAFITVTDQRAMREAETADREINEGKYRGPLHGIPIALKDLIDTAEVPTTGGSAVFENRIPERDATVVRRLRQAGAVFLGKTNLHEFAYGGSGVISNFGPVHNPWDTNRTTGGSSSGSAAAVASGMCFAALGTDTAGSIRLPASYCGIVGLKPTYGVVSCMGVIPLCWSYDHVGPMTRTALDAALVLDAVAGFDPGDANSAPVEHVGTAEHISAVPAGVRFGIAGGMFLTELDPEVEQGFKHAIQQLSRRFDCLPSTVEVPIETDRTIRMAEPYAFHAPLLREHADEYQPATLKRIRSGEAVSAADYINRKNELFMFRRRATALFRDVDVVVSPTVPCLPDRIELLIKDTAGLRNRELHMLRNTRPFNSLGFPAISVPCGTTPGGLPLGLQLTAARGRELLLLQLAHAFEQVTNWPDKLPVSPHSR